MIHASITCWKVELCLREEETEREFSSTYFFATKELAQLAVEWAYENQLAFLRQRGDVHGIETYPNYHGDKKITWWKKIDDHFICMKDYFYCSQEVVRRDIVD